MYSMTQDRLKSLVLFFTREIALNVDIDLVINKFNNSNKRHVLFYEFVIYVFTRWIKKNTEKFIRGCIVIY